MRPYTIVTGVIGAPYLAWLLALRKGQGAEALERIQAALESGGSAADLLTTRGVVYLTLGQPEQAVKDLELAAADEPTPGRYLHLARAHLAANNRVAAGNAWQKAKATGLTPANLDPLERPAYQEVLTALK